MGNQIQWIELLPFLASEKNRKALRFHGFPVSKVRPYFASSRSRVPPVVDLKSVTRQILIMGDKNHQGNKTYLFEILNSACHEQKSRCQIDAICVHLCSKFVTNMHFGFLYYHTGILCCVYTHWCFKQYVIFLN